MEDLSTVQSEQRALENERIFRAANEQIAERRDGLGVDHPTPFICECESPDCRELIRLTASEYREVRATGDRFLIVADHPTRGSLVAERDGYMIVEKAK